MSSRPLTRRWGWSLAPALVLTGFAVWWLTRPAQTPPSPPYSSLHAALIREVGAPPSLAGRLSGFGDRGPHDGGESRPPEEALAFSSGPVPLTRELLQVEAAVERSLSEGATAGELATAGSLELLKRRADKAVSLLERAAKASPSDGRMLGDLALARLELAEQRDAPHLLVDALEVALRAVDVSPTAPEAHFNLAVLLEKLALWHEARTAWEEYLDLDGTSTWASEARRRLEALKERSERAQGPRTEVTAGTRPPFDNEDLERLVSERPSRARKLVEEEVLEGWARAYERDDQEAASEWLEAANTLGRLLGRAEHDALIEDSVAVIETAVARGDASALSRLARGYRAYVEGLETVLHEDCGSPGSPLFTARRLLGSEGSPFVGWVHLQMAICHYYGQHYLKAWRSLDEAGKVAASGRYPNLTGRILWISGLVAMVEGDVSQSLLFYRKALEQFRRTGEADHTAYLNALIAKDLDLLGAREAAWSHRMVSLEARSTLSAAARRFTVLEEAAQSLRVSGHKRSALAFMNELVFETQPSRGTDDEDLLMFARLGRVDALAELGRFREAEEELDRARPAIRRMPPSLQLRERVEMTDRVTEALLEAETRPEDAIDRLEEASRYFTSSDRGDGERIEWTKVQLQKAALLRRLGRTDEAEKSLGTVIGEIERQRVSFREPSLRAEFEMHVARVYEAMIEVELERGEPELALSYVDRSCRWRVASHLGETVFARLASSALPPTSLAMTGALSALADNQAVLVYQAFDESLGIWLLRPSSVHFVRQPVGRSELRRRVNDFRQEIAYGSGAQFQDQARELFGLLIPEELRTSSGVQRLHLVPGPELLGLPFAALQSPASGRYLIEDYTLTTSTTLSDLVPSRAGLPRAARHQPEHVLVVADPAFDGARFPGLQRLKGAASSAARIQRLIPGTFVLTGEDATRTRVLDALRNATLFYFAGHTAVGLAGKREGLILAPSAAPESGRPADVLTTKEIVQAASEAQLELVFLDGCSTALADDLGHDALSGMGGVLVAAGVPTVIATLWAVDDEASSDLTWRYFAQLMGTNNPAEALRETVVAAITQDGRRNEPGHWMALAVFATPPLGGEGSPFLLRASSTASLLNGGRPASSSLCSSCLLRIRFRRGPGRSERSRAPRALVQAEAYTSRPNRN